MTTALFLCGLHREASHWANAWGFTDNEWCWVKDARDVHGRRNLDDGIVFVCGSQPIQPYLVEYLHANGYTAFVDAHDLDTCHEPRSALELFLPGISAHW